MTVEDEKIPARELLEERLSELEREIEAAEDYRLLVGMTPRPPGLSRLSRDVFVYLTNRSIERRVTALRSARDTARTCYGHVLGTQDRANGELE